MSLVHTAATDVEDCESDARGDLIGEADVLASHNANLQHQSTKVVLNVTIFDSGLQEMLVRHTGSPYVRTPAYSAYGPPGGVLSTPEVAAASRITLNG